MSEAFVVQVLAIVCLTIVVVVVVMRGGTIRGWFKSGNREVIADVNAKESDSFPELPPTRKRRLPSNNPPGSSPRHPSKTNARQPAL
jgi:hypothetical protein